MDRLHFFNDDVAYAQLLIIITAPALLHHWNNLLQQWGSKDPLLMSGLKLQYTGKLAEH